MIELATYGINKNNRSVVISTEAEFTTLDSSIKYVKWDDALRGGDFTLSENPEVDDGMFWFNGYKRNFSKRDIKASWAITDNSLTSDNTDDFIAMLSAIQGMKCTINFDNFDNPIRIRSGYVRFENLHSVTFNFNGVEINSIEFYASSDSTNNVFRIVDCDFVLFTNIGGAGRDETLHALTDRMTFMRVETSSNVVIKDSTKCSMVIGSPSRKCGLINVDGLYTLNWNEDGKAGIPLYIAHTTGTSDDCFVYDCEFDKVFTAVLGSSVKRLIVMRNKISNTFDSSIYTRGTGCRIENNTVLNAGKDGIKCLYNPYGEPDGKNHIIDNEIDGAGVLIAEGGTLINNDGKYTKIVNNTLICRSDSTFANTSNNGIVTMGQYTNLVNNTIEMVDAGNGGSWSSGVTFGADAAQGFNSRGVHALGNTITGFGYGYTITDFASNDLAGLRIQGGTVDVVGYVVVANDTEVRDTTSGASISDVTFLRNENATKIGTIRNLKNITIDDCKIIVNDPVNNLVYYGFDVDGTETVLADGNKSFGLNRRFINSYDTSTTINITNNTVDGVLEKYNTEESYITTSATRPTINKRYPNYSVMFETDTGKQIYNNNGVWEYIVTA